MKPSTLSPTPSSSQNSIGRLASLATNIANLIENEGLAVSKTEMDTIVDLIIDLCQHPLNYGTADTRE